MQLAHVNILYPELFILLVVVSMNIIVCGVFFFVKRCLPASFIKEPKSFLQPLIGFVSVSFAILLGLLIVTLWGWFLKAQEGTYKEAADLASLTYFSLTLPLPIQSEFLEAIGQYIHYVVQDEWVLQRSGKISIKTQQALDHLFDVFLSYSPETETQKVFYGQVTRTLDNLIQNRFMRISKFDSIMIPALRFFLFFGAVLIAALFAFYESTRVYFHLLIIVLFTSIVWFNVGVALTLDYPYSGLYSIKADVFTQGILSRFKNETHIN